MAKRKGREIGRDVDDDDEEGIGGEAVGVGVEEIGRKSLAKNRNGSLLNGGPRVKKWRKKGWLKLPRKRSLWRKSAAGERMILERGFWERGSRVWLVRRDRSVRRRAGLHGPVKLRASGVRSLRRGVVVSRNDGIPVGEGSLTFGNEGRI